MSTTLGPRDIGGILGDTFRIYGSNFLRLIAIVAIVQVPLGILAIVFGLVGFLGLNGMSALGNLWAFIGTLVIFIVIFGLLIVATSSVHASRLHTCTHAS